MKKKYIVVILIIALLINTFIVIYSKAANSVNWYERYDYNSEEIQNLIKQKNKIQSETNVAPQKDGFDLIIFMGQSNMVGKGGDATKAVQPIDGAGYEMLFNSNNEAQGLKKVSEPFGEGTNNDVGGSMVTAFMNAYYNNTGTPVIGIPAASSGTSVYDYWQDGQTGLENAKSKLQSAIQWLDKKGYKIKHRYVIWNQGEADVENTKEYSKALRKTVDAMQNAGADRCFMIRIGTIYLYNGYEEKYKEKYYKYLDMINEQDKICKNNWMTLVSTSMATLSKCQNMMSDMVHFNQEALDIIGSEAGKNVALYADQSRGRTLTTDQENALINYANNFSYWGTKNDAILYGTLMKGFAYNLQPVPYKDQKNSNGEYIRKIIHNSEDYSLTWRNLETNQDFPIGRYGFNGEKFNQKNYIGLDCSGFVSFLYHQVLGVPFNYEHSGTKYAPWTAQQYIENRKIKNASGEKEISAFKVVYQKIFETETIKLKDILDDVNFQKGDIMVGYNGNGMNHVVMYIGKDENGKHKMIHSTDSPILCNMYYKDLKKFYSIGESYFVADDLYKEIYVLRLNNDIVPSGYVTNEAYKTKSSKSYIDWNKIIAGEKIDSVAPQGQIEYIKQKGKTIVNITTTEDVMQVDGWKLSKDKRLLTKVFTQDTSETVRLEDLSANTTKLNIKVEVDNNDLTAQVSYSTTELTNQDVVVTIKANKQLQAINGWTLLSDKQTLTKTYTSNTTGTVTIKDLAGNTATVTVKIANIDKTAPTAQVSYSITELTNQDVVVTIKANKQLQVIDSWMLSTDKLSLTKTYTSNATENVTIKDIAGNTATVNVKINNIDKTAPTAQVSYSTTELTNQDVVVTIKANEQLQAINGWSLSTDKLSLTKTYAINTTEDITIKDLAGNIATVTIKISNIDKTAPIAQVSYSTTELTNQDVVVTIKANEKIQKVDGWTLSIDKLSMTKTYTSNTTENVTIKDLAGNTTTVTINVANINKKQPTFELKQYQIKDNYIVKIKPKTKYRDFIKDIETNQKYTIKEKNTEISEEDLIKTGQTLTTEEGHTYTLVVIGDLNGDGGIGIVELARISKIGAGKENDVKEIEKMAIDVNADGKINIIDLAAISKYATE